MQLTNPPWVNHDGGAIYSIDIHPNADKLLTCGQGSVGGSGVVVVWNLLPIRDEKAVTETDEPKVLARIQHQAGVNCIRWSRDGLLFACASDDKVVTLYEYGGRVKSSGTIGSREAHCIEKYRCAHTLHSHTMEVMSVEWSQDGRFLASSSMDNTVIVWNARRLPERLVVLDSARGGHDGPVKGVSWDPVGKYLATQSADKSVRIWTTDNWQMETTVKEPFKESGQTTMFSRLGWSADGQFLFAPCAMNNQGPVAQVVRRKDWDTSLDMVGHRKAVTAVRVADRLIEYKDSAGKIVQVSCVAVGSRDKSLSVWVFPLVKRPVLVISRLFKHSIMDISWNGLDLAVCSQDGSIKYLSFTEKELGKRLSEEQMGDVCESLYKLRPSQFEMGGPLASFSSSSIEGMPDTPTRGGGGGVNGGSAAAGLNSTFIETAEQLMEKQRKEQSTTSAVSTTTASSTSAAAVCEAKQRVEALAEKRKEQIEVKTKDGKRRIQPIFLSSTVDEGTSTASSSKPSTAEPSVAKPQPVITTVSTSSIKTASIPAKKGHVEVSTDDSTAAESSDDESMDTDERESATEGETQTDKRTETEKKQQMLQTEFKKPTLRAIDATRVVVSDVTTVLDVAEQRAELEEAVAGVPGDVISVSNSFLCGGVRATRISLLRSGCQQWTAFTAPSVAILTANRHWVVAGCFDRGLRVLMTSSGILKHSLQMDGVAVRVGLTGHKMFALSQTGKFSSWDLGKGKCLLSRLPISDCVTQDSSLTSISVSVAGMPLLGFSTGNLFTYSMEMQTWTLLDSNTSLLRLSDSIDTDELGEGQLARLLKKRRRVGPAPNVPSGIRTSVRQSQLEAWLSSALSAGSHNDYRRIMMAYVQQLIRDRSQEKLRQIVSSLDGVGLICGIQKSALRADVHRAIGSDPVTAKLLPQGQPSVF